MRKGGGKAKGSAFEREICRRLSLWVSAGKHEDVFWRSAMSGGRSTVAHAKGKRMAQQAGDISCIHPAGHCFINLFVCECKAYKDLNYDGLITGKGNLITFWDILRREGKRYGKYPLLIAKQNRFPTTIITQREALLRLALNTKDALLTCPSVDMFIFEADFFFEYAGPPQIARERIK